MQFILDNTPATVQLQARRTQTGLECLAELFSGKDHRVKAQVATYVASGYAFINMPLTALLYIGKSCDFIKAGNLQFVPTCGRPPELSEDLHETLVFLSQTVYMANYLFLMCGGPEPTRLRGLRGNSGKSYQSVVTSVLLDIQLISHDSEPTRFSSRSVL